MWVKFEQLFLQMLIEVHNKLVWTLKSSEDIESSYCGMLKTRQS